MTRRGLLAPLLATVATAACAPIMGEGLLTPAPLGPPGWRRARAAYGLDPRQTLRLYRPARAQGLPILALMPDGAPAAEDERTARDLSERGFIVALTDRRTAPGSVFPAFIGDGASAVAWLSKRAHDLSGDAVRIGVLGMGEGGRAALMLALDRRYLAAASASGAVRAAAGVGDTRQSIIIQVIRILILTICVPIGALFLPIGHYEGAPVQAAMALETLLPVAAACAVAGFVLTKLRAPAGYVLGAMAVAITAKFTGLFEGAMPQPLLIATFVLIGALIGSRFNGITRAEFKQAAIGGLAGTALTVAIATLVTLAVAPFVDMPFGQIWLGLSPGALEGMGALGIALGFDTAFIAAHHVSRLLMLTFAIPVVAMLIRDKELP